jgi:hypothetical protein
LQREVTIHGQGGAAARFTSHQYQLYLLRMRER